MVLAYHAIFGTYGFWLPNDPRGSESDFVFSWELFRFGAATKVEPGSRRSVAGRKHNTEARLAAKENLKYPPAVLDDAQIVSVARGFERMVNKAKYEVHACAIMPDHVHLVLGRYRYNVETMVRLLKAEASATLREDGVHPMLQWPDADGVLPTPWALRGWNVFLNTDADVYRAIAYVERNPMKEDLPAQTWPFVKPWTPKGVTFSPGSQNRGGRDA